MRYSTGNPVGLDGSSSPFDLHDNAGIADQLVTGTERQYPNRLGEPTRSFSGMNLDFDEKEEQRDSEFTQDQVDREEKFQQFLLSSGYDDIGDYAAGLIITGRNQIFLRSGQYYRAKGTVALPYTTTGNWSSESSNFVSVGDAALRQELAQADGDTLVNTRAGRTQRQKNDEHVSVADYGAVGSGDETVIFNNTALAADGREILIPFPSFTINAAANAQGCIVRGQNTLMDGVPRNCAGMVGISIRGFRQDQLNNYLPEPGTKSPMLVRRANESAYFVATRKPGRKNGYVVFQLLKDLATDVNSLGGNQQFLRCGFVHNCTGVYGTRLQGESLRVGTWSAYNVAASVLGHGSDDAWSPLVIRQSTSPDAALTFTIVVPRNGKISLGIMGSSGSPPAVELSVDGVVQKTVNPQGWIGAIYSITLDAVPGSRSVRIRNASGSGTLYFAGFNYHRLDEVDPELSYDTLAIYRNASLPFYVKNQGAHDYAIWDHTAAKYGGSYHGGESIISRNLVVNGSVLAMTDGQLVAADDFYIQQVTQIDWSGQIPAGGVIQVDSLLTFREGQSDLHAAFKAIGSIPSIIRHMHTGMNGVNDEISQLVFPRNEAVGENTYLGQTSKVILQHPGTKSLSITDFNLYSGIESREGGAFINRTPDTYNKIYYAYVYEGRRPLASLAFTCRRTFR